MSNNRSLVSNYALSPTIAHELQDTRETLLKRSARLERRNGADYSIPTLSRSFVAAPFQLGLVWLSALSTLPPNPSACPRVGVWDKPWDKFANHFETASPQFRFCPRGQKRVSFEALKRPI